MLLCSTTSYISIRRLVLRCGAHNLSLRLSAVPLLAGDRARFEVLVLWILRAGAWTKAAQVGHLSLY